MGSFFVGRVCGSGWGVWVWCVGVDIVDVGVGVCGCVWGNDCVGGIQLCVQIVPSMFYLLKID